MISIELHTFKKVNGKILSPFCIYVYKRIRAKYTVMELEQVCTNL